jgi:hypothetical protein
MCVPRLCISSCRRSLSFWMSSPLHAASSASGAGFSGVQRVAGGHPHTRPRASPLRTCYSVPGIQGRRYRHRWPQQRRSQPRELQRQSTFDKNCAWGVPICCNNPIAAPVAYPPIIRASSSTRNPQNHPRPDAIMASAPSPKPGLRRGDTGGRRRRDEIRCRRWPNPGGAGGFLSFGRPSSLVNAKKHKHIPTTRPCYTSTRTTQKVRTKMPLAEGSNCAARMKTFVADRRGRLRC